MSRMPKPHEIQKAAKTAGLDLTVGQAKLLSEGAILPLASMNITPSAAAGECKGIRIANIGRRCGIYFVPWPSQLSVCCEPKSR